MNTRNFQNLQNNIPDEVEKFFETKEFEWNGHIIKAVVSEATARLYNKYLPVLRSDRGIDSAIRRTAVRMQRKMKRVTREDAQALAEDQYSGIIQQTSLSVALWAILQDDLLQPVIVDGKKAIDCRLDEIQIPSEYWDAAELMEDRWAEENTDAPKITFNSGNIIEVGVALITQFVKDPDVKRIVQPLATKVVWLGQIYAGGIENDSDQVGFLYEQLDELLSRSISGSDSPIERKSAFIGVNKAPAEPDRKTRLDAGAESTGSKV